MNKKISAGNTQNVDISSLRDFANHYEHHSKLKATPLTPFTARMTNRGKNYRCNWHENIEILSVTDGEGYIRYDAELIHLKRGLTVMINSKSMHHIYSEKGISFYAFIVDTDFFLENGIDIQTLCFEKYTDNAQTSKIISNTYNEIKVAESTGGRMATAKMRNALLSMLIHLCTNHVSEDVSIPKTQSPSEEHVKRAMIYINDHCTKDIGLEEIAEKTGINKSYLAREFKKYTGYTVHTYINILRCQLADQCFADGMSVTQAALSSGFETLSYFSRTYKKLRGISPAEAKEKLCKTEIYH